MQWKRYRYERGYGAIRLTTPLRPTEKIMLSNDDGENLAYNLISVIYHFGETLKSGHYTAAVKHFSGVWKYCNDEEVQEITGSIEELFPECVYITIYEAE